MRRLLAISVLLSAMAAQLVAVEPAEEPTGSAPAGFAAGSPRPSETSLDRWQWMFDVPLAATVDAKWGGFILKPQVFALARPDLADLRLFDAKRREVPFALRVLREKREEKVLNSRQFNVQEMPDGSIEATLDLGENPIENQVLEVNTPGGDFRRRVQIDGSKDGSDWGSLAGDWIASFRVQGRDIDIRRVNYPPSRFRYLRVRVAPDKSKGDDKPKIDSIKVLHTVQVPGEDLVLPAVVEPRQAIRAYGAAASAWFVELGADRTPCERLTLDVGGDDFSRRYSVETPGLDNSYQQVAEGELRRPAGAERKPLEIRMHQEAAAKRLRLVVIDHQNQPLDLRGVTFSAPAREIVYALGTDIVGPLRLYVGNPKAEAARYDFQASLPETLVPPPVRTELGSIMDNPDYRPEPKPLTERWPWLPYVVLGTASLILLCLLALLGRETIRRQDSAAGSAA